MTRAFRLLLVEDSPLDAELVHRTLRRAAVSLEELRVVDDTTRFRQTLEEGIWDAVLSDYNLPSFDALRALAILRESGRRIPFLLVSGAVGEEKAAEAVRQGAAGFVSKSHLERLPVLLLRSVVEAAAERREDAARRAAEQAIAEQKHLLSIVSHDVRAPLQAFRLGLTQAQSRIAAGDWAALQHCFSQLDQAAERMGRLIDDVLDYSKLDAGCFELQRDVGDLRAVVEAMAEEARVLASERRIRVVGRWPGHPVTVSFDRKRLEQVVGNLLSNALKYSPPEGVVEVVLEEIGHDARISVLDQGSGIAAEDLPHLFQRYWQSTRSRGGGVGLGLYIVHRLVALHGGRVWAENRREGGSALHFSIPRQVTASRQSGLGEGALVAVVDDDDFSREILRGLLLDEGFRVVDWANASETLSALREAAEAPAAAVIDARLPDLPGVELAMALVAGTEFPAVARIVLVSADPDAGTEAPPSIRFLPKPVDLEQLLAVLKGRERWIPLPPGHADEKRSVPER